MSICSKLRSRKGETLTETLVALLIVGLSSVVLASMIGAASRMGTQAAERDKAMYEEVAAAEARTGDSEDGSVTVTVGDTNQTIDVKYYGGEDGLHSYVYEKIGGEP